MPHPRSPSTDPVPDDGSTDLPDTGAGATATVEDRPATAAEPADPDRADTTMSAVLAAVSRGREGDRRGARDALDDLWSAIGPAGDPLHRCTLAHYLADLQDDPARALVWDVRALDAADALTDDRARRHDPGLSVRGFYPSLHLNLADNFRRLGSFEAACHEIEAARARLHDLPEDEYGAMIRTALVEVEAACRAGDTTARPSAPS